MSVLQCVAQRVGQAEAHYRQAMQAGAAFTAAGSCAWKCSDGYMPQGAGCVKSPIPSPPMPPPLAVLGPTNVPVSYFSNYQAREAAPPKGAPPAAH
jgi:hypothetical protein